VDSVFLPQGPPTDLTLLHPDLAQQGPILDQHSAVALVPRFPVATDQYHSCSKTACRRSFDVAGSRREGPLSAQGVGRRTLTAFSATSATFHVCQLPSPGFPILVCLCEFCHKMFDVQLWLRCYRDSKRISRHQTSNGRVR
jgi:hypothetical protein